MRKVLMSIGLVMLLAGVPGSFGQTNPTLPQPLEVTPLGYPVTLGDQTLFYIKRDVKGYSAEERAKAISERIKGFAENPGIPIEAVATADFDIPLTQITLNDKMLMVVFDEEALAEGRGRQELAREYAEKLRTTVGKYRQDRSLKSLLTSSLLSLVATVVLVALLVFLRRLYRRIDASIQTWADSKRVSIHIQSFELVRAERIRLALTGVTKTLRFVVLLGIFYLYVHFCLHLFPWTKEITDDLFGYILIPFRVIGGAIWTETPKLLFVAVIAFITIYTLKLMRLFFQEIEKGAITFKGFYPEWAQPTFKICRLLVVAIAAVVAFPYIPGSASPAFKGISIFVGVLFSLGSSSAIANMVAGLTLTYRRGFKVGDRVKIADFVGDVVEMRLQVTHLRTIKNEEITVPNSMIVNSHVINYSALAKTKGLILHTTVTIGYDAPWRQVEALLLMAAEKTSGVMTEPAPFVLQKSLDDFYVSYELNVYTDTPLLMAQIYSALHRNIQDAFNEYGVQIMSPAYETDPDRQKIVPKDQWYARPAKPPDGSRIEP